jgi:hypothetical protein
MRYDTAGRWLRRVWGDGSFRDMPNREETHPLSEGVTLDSICQFTGQSPTGSCGPRQAVRLCAIHLLLSFDQTADSFENLF